MTAPALRLFLFLAVAALCGCGRAPDRADFVFLNGAEPESIDPAIITGQPDGRIAYALFEGLTSFNAAGVAGPGVAVRAEIVNPLPTRLQIFSFSSMISFTTGSLS